MLFKIISYDTAFNVVLFIDHLSSLLYATNGKRVNHIVCVRYPRLSIIMESARIDCST